MKAAIASCFLASSLALLGAEVRLGTISTTSKFADFYTLESVGTGSSAPARLFNIDGFNHAGSWTVLNCGDPQMYGSLHVAGGAWLYQLTNMVDWAISNKEAMNIKATMFMGDIADWPPYAGAVESSNEMVNVYTQIKRLRDSGILALVGTGNHDYDDTTNRVAHTWDALFNAYFFTNQSGFGGRYGVDNYRSYYYTQTNSGQRMLYLVLEAGPMTNTVLWASNVVAQHQDHTVWLMTHAYTLSNGRRINGPTTRSDLQYLTTMHPFPDSCSGEEIYQLLTKWFGNIGAVHSGHVISGAVPTSDPESYDTNAPSAWQYAPTVRNTLVFETVYNMQYLTNGGSGFWRVMHVQPDQNLVRCHVYSPVWRCGKNDDSGQWNFFFPLRPAVAQTDWEVTNGATITNLFALSTFRLSADSVVGANWGNDWWPFLAGLMVFGLFAVGVMRYFVRQHERLRAKF